MATLKLKHGPNMANLSDFLSPSQKQKLDRPNLKRGQKEEEQNLFDLSPDEKNVLACIRYARREIDLNTLILGVWVRTGRTLEQENAIIAVRSLQDRGLILQPMPGIFKAVGDRFFHAKVTQ